MLNTYSVVFTGGRNTCINTRVHSDPLRQPAAATEYSPLLLPPTRVRVRRPGKKRFRATVPQRLTIGPEIGSEVNAPLN